MEEARRPTVDEAHLRASRRLRRPLPTPRSGVAGPGPSVGPRDFLSATSGLIVVITLLLGSLVAVRQGNLAWDDADYLRDGLRLANFIRANAATRPGSALDALLDIRPKPPLLVAWIAGGSLLSGGRSPVPLIVFASVVPFAILLGAVAATSRALFGGRAGWFSASLVVASPLALSFGAKVMVETFMSLWVLLAYFFAARLLDRPARGPALGLGAALGCALMTKLTVALLLPAPALGFAVIYARRHGTGREAARIVGWISSPLLAIALPWYCMNGGAAVRFAAFSSRYNVVALGESGGPPRIFRLAQMAHDLAGWPLLATLGVAALGWLLRGRGAAAGVGRAIAPRMFAGLTLLGLVSGAAILLVPSYFDSRFLLPIWPAVAACLGPVLRDAIGRRVRPLALATAGLLAASVHASAGELARERPSETFWGARALIDRLVADYRVKIIDNVGNCRDWNVSKVGMVNELRDRPGDCFVLHDLSGGTPDEIVRRLAGADAVVALDRSRLPAEWFAYGPKLNRGCLGAIVYLGLSPEFRRVEAIPTEGLPPLLVFVRKR